MTDLQRRRADLISSVAIRLVALAAAGLVLVYLKSILVPLVLAILLSFLLLPLVGALTARGVPSVVAILGAQTVATLPFLGVVMVAVATSGPLQAEISEYPAMLNSRVAPAIDAVVKVLPQTEWRDKVRQQIGEQAVPEVLGEAASVLQNSFVAATTFLGFFFLTLLLSSFILLEGRRFREKFGEAYGVDHPLLGSLEGIGRDVRAYVVAKTLISALTGFSVWIFLELCGVDFAILWGLLAFPLNFIPTVGAFVASVPPILVALVDSELSTGMTVLVVVGLLAINGAIGSVLDPRFVGQRVKLSPLVVFLSMLIWYVLWGPVGMILAVPIMVSVKVICERVPALAPVATMMQG